MKQNILLMHPLPFDWISHLDGQVKIIVNTGNGLDLHQYTSEQLRRIDGVLCFLSDYIDSAFLDQLPELRIVSNMAAGIDNIDIKACSKRGIPVGNTPGAMTEATADITFSLILGAGRRLIEASFDARNGKWKTWTPDGWLGMDLKNSTLGIIGFGKIGRAVAKRAKGFGMRVVYWEPIRHLEKENEVAAEYMPLNALISTSDIISLHCPLNDSTRGLINSSTLKMMKPTAILINTSRGPVIDMDALTRALKEKRILSAGLDVTDPEPLPPTHPLYDLPNCLILPHIGSATFGTRKQMARMACENLLAGLKGERLPYCVNPEVYD